MTQGLHPCLYCCYDSYCKGTNFFSIVYRLATVFGLASVHSPHRVCRVRPKSFPVIKERNCSVSLVLDCRTQRKNATEFPLAMRFTIDRKFFYYVVGSTYTEKQFSDICNATKSASENYREQRMWRETIVPKYKNLLAELNKGSLFTYEMVRVAVTTGNTSLQEEDDRSFMSIWEKIIHDLKTNDGGTQFTTGQNYEYALKSFRKIMGYDAITGFNISVAEIQKG